MELLIKKKCELCGKVFSTPYLFKKYCSSECKAKSNLKAFQARGKTPAIKTCPICGENFPYSKKHQKYCSFECAESAAKIKTAKAKGGYSEDKYLFQKKPKPEPKPQDIKQEQRAQQQENFNRLIDEADQCGLSYGKYVAQLRIFGKTFEELRAAHLASLQQ